MKLYDAFTIDGVRRTADGYLAAFARVARTGIQEYRGSEVGRPEMDTVRVYRPPEEVFHADALKSFAHRPVTLTHPRVQVTSKNWKRYAGGQTGDEVVRDGEFIRVPMVMMDQGLIDAYERGGIKELSMGYSTDLKWRTGIVDAGPDAGQHYDAVQTAIRGNHLAVVPTARGGDQLRIGDDGSFRFMVDKLKAEDPDPEDDEDEDDQMQDAWSDEARAAALEARKARAVSNFRNELRSQNIPHQYSKEGNEVRVSIKHETGKTFSKSNNFMRMAKKHGMSSPYYDQGYAHFYPKEDVKDSSSISDADYVDCPECGAEIPSDSTRCPECGTLVSPTRDGVTIMKVLTIDGVPVQVADDQTAAVIARHISKLEGEVKTANDAATASKTEADKANQLVADAKTVVGGKDGEIVALKQQLKDAEITPEKLDVLVKDRVAVIDRAKLLLDKSFSFDGKKVEDIRRAAVAVRVTDAVATAMDDANVAGAFLALTTDVKQGGARPFADALRGQSRTIVGDAAHVRDAAYTEAEKNLSNAWKKTPASAA